MWVRVTCPNGHRVKIETKYLGRENRCPRCQTRVNLWIHVVCSNGHTLRVQSKYAGRMGTCPECQERVMVPDLTEVIAMETLGDDFLDDAEDAVADDGDAVGTDMTGAEEESSILAAEPPVPMRECPSCKAKIPKAHKTCPHCQKYLGEADLTEAPADRSIKCPTCGVTSLPGDVFCSSCGTPLE